jgi:hypothetical protein
MSGIRPVAGSQPIAESIMMQSSLVKREMRKRSTPLERTLAQIDDVVDGLRPGDAVRARIGGIAASNTQMSYYSKVAAALPRGSSICEVGFNVGHSAAVFLHANPDVTLHTFDLFRAKEMRACLEFMQRLFPGRIHAHRGDSRLTVPNATITPKCALVHVDGKHDCAQRRRAARPRTQARSNSLTAHARPLARSLSLARVRRYLDALGRAQFCPTGAALCALPLR